MNGCKEIDHVLTDCPPLVEAFSLNAIQHARARYLQNMHDAMRMAAENIRKGLGVECQLKEFTRATQDGISKWGKNEFDWDDILRNIRDPDCFRFGIWVADRLTAVAIATTSNQSVCLRFIEADRREDAPLTGLRILIALEAIAIYGQLRGKSEIRLEPVNEKLISLYEDTYGFEVVPPRKGAPRYWRKRI